MSGTPDVEELRGKLEELQARLEVEEGARVAAQEALVSLAVALADREREGAARAQEAHVMK